MDIIEKIDCWAEIAPNRVAIKYKDLSITYSELKVITSNLAAQISRHTTQKQKPIIILCNRNERMLVSILSVMKSGNIFIPIELPYPHERVENIVKQLKEFIVITDEEKNQMSNSGLQFHNVGKTTFHVNDYKTESIYCKDCNRNCNLIRYVSILTGDSFIVGGRCGKY